MNQENPKDAPTISSIEVIDDEYVVVYFTTGDAEVMHKDDVPKDEVPN